MIQIYTGNGKGKTTAALGLALRAAGHRKEIIMLQFMKGKINYGELKASKRLGNFDIEQYGRKEFVDRDNPAAVDRALARRGMDRAWEVVRSREYDVIILDEINIALEYGLVSLAEVIRLVKSVSRKTELILTGRYMPDALVRHADLVSDVREIKHYFHKGVKARKGIEY